MIDFRNVTRSVLSGKALLRPAIIGWDAGRANNKRDVMAVVGWDADKSQ